MTILAERDLTDVEREAVAYEPRPGVWVEGSGDRFEQVTTDLLIVNELAIGLDEDARRELAGFAGVARQIHVGRSIATRQRGGIHSEPLVRLLAFRAWGDRDRAWCFYRPDGVHSWIPLEAGFIQPNITKAMQAERERWLICKACGTATATVANRPASHPTTPLLIR